MKIIEEKGLDNQGLYRVPGNTGALKELQEDIDKVRGWVRVDWLMAISRWLVGCFVYGWLPFLLGSLYLTF